MALIYQEGMLEPVSVQENVQACMEGLNTAGSRDWLFASFLDYAGDTVVVQIPTITRITENA